MIRFWGMALGLAVLSAGCQPVLDVAAPSPREGQLPRISEAEIPEPTGGVARVAIPSQPAGRLPVDGLDVAGGDLLALWGLPLYRVDAHGLPRPALVEAAAVSADGIGVELRLRSGSWSDGEPVTGHDLAATVEAVRALDDPHDDLAWLEGVEVDEADAARVTLQLTHPTRRWPDLLAATGVLPAHVLADTPLEEWDSPPPVVGGPFAPVDSQPGLGWRFEAHPDGPLGPPTLEGLEVLVVPSFDTALGLLGRDELDAIVGHLAVRPQLRLDELADEERFSTGPDELMVAAPHGGTEVALRFAPDGVLGGPPELRRAVRAVAEVEHLVEGLGVGVEVGEELVAAAEPAAGAPAGDEAAEPDALSRIEAAMVVSNEQETLVEVARLLEAQVRGGEGSLRIEGEATPHDVERADDLDLSLVVRRPSHDPDLRRYLPDGEQELAMAAEAAVTRSDAAVVEAWARAAEHAGEVPLFRARVAHVWREDLEGLEPSAWPGVGLGSAHRWRLVDRP